MRKFLLAATLLAATPVFAQTPPQRIRGTITSLAGDALIVHATDDSDVTVQLAPETGIRGDTPSSLEAIKPGSTLAIVAHGSAEKQEAVGVRVIGPGVTVRLGLSAWDVPQTTMTNAVVDGEAQVVSGRDVTLKANEKTVQMTFPPSAVIAMELPGDRAMLVPGAKVAIFATPGAGGALKALAVIVGLQGMTPPL